MADGERGVLPELPLPRLQSCQAAIERGGWSVVGQPLVLLVYASHIASPWYLGLSAALHGMPLAIAGLGSRGDWPWYAGGTPKLNGSRRALRALRALLPPESAAPPIALVDGFDTFIANAPSAALRDALSRLSARDVYLGGECLHYPVCRIDEMRALPSYRQCHAGGYAACAPNGGGIFGKPTALERLLDATLRTIAERKVESGLRYFTSRHDQGALQQLVLDGSAGVDIRIDHASTFMLNLHTCATRSNATKLIKGFSHCRDRYHVPMAGVRVPNATELVYWPRGLPRKSCRAAACPSSVRPLLAHANGAHSLLHHPKLAPIVQRLSALAPPARLFDHPVLLLGDDASGGDVSSSGSVACRVVALGELAQAKRMTKRSKEHTSTSVADGSVSR